MSLEKDIYKAYTDSMGGESKLDDLSKKSLKTLSSNLSKAFINFLTKQEFRIVQHEIDVSIDTIKTTSELFGDLTEDVTIEEQPLDNYNKVVKIPALDLKSSYGQGGSLKAEGSLNHKQSNYKSSTLPDPQSKKSVVKLFKGEVKE
tara:strand:+ start:205 stop:642 length:438 start_codon:yes stop_codon:yes gene_type:complete